MAIKYRIVLLCSNTYFWTLANVGLRVKLHSDFVSYSEVSLIKIMDYTALEVDFVGGLGNAALIHLNAIIMHLYSISW